MEENQKKVPAKRIQLVDVVLERKGSQMFEGRRVRSPEDVVNIIRDFIGDSDREKLVALQLKMSKRCYKSCVLALLTHQLYIHMM